MERCFSVDDLLDPLTRLQLLAWAKNIGISGIARKRKEDIRNHVQEAFQKSIQWQLYGCPYAALRRIAFHLGPEVPNSGRSSLLRESMSRYIFTEDFLAPLTRQQLQAWAISLGMSGLSRKKKKEIMEQVQKSYREKIKSIFETCPDEIVKRLAVGLGLIKSGGGRKSSLRVVLKKLAKGPSDSSAEKRNLTKHEFRYFSKTMHNIYISEVRRSQILNSENEPDRRPEGAFAATLANSRRLARREFAVCHEYMLELFAGMSSMETAILKDMDTIGAGRETYKIHWEPIFKKFYEKLGKIFQYAQEKLVGSFAQKVRRMDHFCICLFGRTKAGKSSTMEALTCGDGQSIGLGRQNTTRDVKEYFWKELLVVDTPGIDAMDNQQELEEMALAFADDSDLIVFLLPHQIEEGDFEKFSRFYKQNKPIFILLNVKTDPGKKGSVEFRHFIKYPEDVLDTATIAGYKSRIRDFIFDQLHIPSDLIPIIPIHAKAAFMAAKEPESEISQALREISNFNALEQELAREIRNYGELYRIKNPYDSVLLFCSVIRSEFQAFHRFLSNKETIFRNNLEQFEAVKKQINTERDRIIKDTVSSYYISKQKAVQGIVEKLFEEKGETKREKILDNFLPQNEVNRRIRICQEELGGKITEIIQNFFDKFSGELRNLVMKRSSVASKVGSDIKNIDGIKGTGDLLNRAGYGASLGSLGAFWLGSAMPWNPVGWGLLAAGVVFKYWSQRKKKQAGQKLLQAKKKAGNALKRDVIKRQADIERELKRWTLQLVNAIDYEHIQIMEQYTFYANNHLKRVKQLVDQLSTLEKRARQKKFQSMIGSLTRLNNLKVFTVKESRDQIRVGLKSIPEINIASLCKALSRVEEKNVLIQGGAA